MQFNLTIAARLYLSLHQAIHEMPRRRQPVTSAEDAPFADSQFDPTSVPSSLLNLELQRGGSGRTTAPSALQGMSTLVLSAPAAIRSKMGEDRLPLLQAASYQALTMATGEWRDSVVASCLNVSTTYRCVVNPIPRLSNGPTVWIDYDRANVGSGSQSPLRLMASETYGGPC